MTFCLHGLGVSDGIAIGRARLVTPIDVDVAHYEVPRHEIGREVRRFDRAVSAVRDEFSELEGSIEASAPQELKAFIDLHRMLLEDPILLEATRERIRKTASNAEWAVTQQMQALVQQFEEIEDEYLRERKSDVVQVVERVLAALAQDVRPLTDRVKSVDEDSILVARDLSPADVILFKERAFAAFLTDVGGKTSHTAILARSLAIPSIVALQHGRQLIREDETIIVDGTQGVVIVEPDKRVLDEYRLRKEALEIERQKLRRLRTAKPETLDGIAVDLYANIELPSDLDLVRQSGATGVGLFRSEFLFLNRDELPSEEEQFEAYRAVVEGMKGQPVVIRTLDVGADKALAANGDIDASAGPLGLRAIRFCLAEPDMFLAQLRAILRASRYGKVIVLLPMLSTVSELQQTLALIEHAKQQLSDAKRKFGTDVRVGGMIEVPAAALALPMFMDKLDYLSIGTNDLIQYTLAIDRTDDSVAHLYNPLHPAILYLVAHVIRTAQAAKMPIAVCGEMAGDVEMTRLLLGMGLRQFSMHPANILTVKQRILATGIEDARSAVARILKTDDPERVRTLVDKLNG